MPRRCPLPILGCVGVVVEKRVDGNGFGATSDQVFADLLSFFGGISDLGIVKFLDFYELAGVVVAFG